MQLKYFNLKIKIALIFFFFPISRGMTKAISLCFSKQLCPLILIKISNTNLKAIEWLKYQKTKFKVMFRNRAVVWVIFLVQLICFTQVIDNYICPKFLYKLVKNFQWGHTFPLHFLFTSWRWPNMLIFTILGAYSKV